MPGQDRPRLGGPRQKAGAECPEAGQDGRDQGRRTRGRQVHEGQDCQAPAIPDLRRGAAHGCSRRNARNRYRIQPRRRQTWRAVPPARLERTTGFRMGKDSARPRSAKGCPGREPQHGGEVLVGEEGESVLPGQADDPLRGPKGRKAPFLGKTPEPPLLLRGRGRVSGPEIVAHQEEGPGKQDLRLPGEEGPGVGGVGKAFDGVGGPGGLDRRGGAEVPGQEAAALSQSSPERCIFRQGRLQGAQGDPGHPDGQPFGEP